MENKRKRILDMVKDGKLSTDEALTLLEALDREEAGEMAPKEDPAESWKQDANGGSGEAGSTSGQKKFRDADRNINETKEKLFDLVGGALKK